jgi:hypothetical protein
MGTSLETPPLDRCLLKHPFPRRNLCSPECTDHCFHLWLMIHLCSLHSMFTEKAGAETGTSKVLSSGLQTDSACPVGPLSRFSAPRQMGTVH